jgi:hypothetical protein
MSDSPSNKHNDPDALQRQASREEQRLAAFLRAREEQQRQQDQRQARIQEEHGARIAKDIESRIDTSLDGSEQVRDLAAALVAQELAKRSITFEQVSGPDRGRLYDQVIHDAHIATEAQRKHQEASEREAEKARAVELEKQQQLEAREQKEREAGELEKREAAKREPVPNAMQRFNALLAERKAQTNAAAIDRAGQLADNRPSFARHDVLNRPQEPSIAKASSSSEKDAERPTPRGEITDAKAERFARMFNNPSRDKDFDPTHDPGNSRNFASGRGGRGGR